MSAKIDVLQVGYARELNIREKHDIAHKYTNCSIEDNSSYQLMEATGSSCLVRSSGECILFDTMGPWDKDTLLARLESMKIHPDDIKYIVCSHGHPDHAGNLNLFTKAQLQIVGTQVFSKDLYRIDFFKPMSPWIDGDKTYPRSASCRLSDNLCLEFTPGHTLDDITLVVSNVDGKGIVALAGDLFEREEDLRDESIWLGAGSQNPGYQRFHRKRILNNVDYIMPGHGPMMRISGEQI